MTAAATLAMLVWLPAADATGPCTVASWNDLVSAFQGTDTSCASGEVIQLTAAFTASYGTSGNAVQETSSDQLAVSAGDPVTLDLAGQTLYIDAKSAGEAGIEVPSGASLTIEDSAGGGVLNVSGGTGSGGSPGGGGGAGIGGAGGSAGTSGGPGGASGTVTIDSGTVTATGGLGGGGGEGGGGGAGIGGGGSGSEAGDGAGSDYAGAGGAGGTVKVAGGSVTATGGDGSSNSGGSGGGGGAGIGGGGSGHYAGNDATGTYAGAGGAGASVQIDGGTVSAAGGSGDIHSINAGGGGAGIGGGGSGSGAGTVLSSAYTQAGFGGAGGSLTVAGGSVSSATGGSGDASSSSGSGGGGGAGIGGGGSGSYAGYYSNSDGAYTSEGGAGAAITIDSGGVTVDAGGAGNAGGTSGPSVGGGGDGGATAGGSGAFGSLSNSGTLTVPAGVSLDVPDSDTAYNSGTIELDGTLGGVGTVDNTGTIDVGRFGSVSDNGLGPAGTDLWVEPDNYYLTIDPGNNVISSSEYVYAPTVSLGTPTPPSGELFSGWYTARTGGSQVTSSTLLDSVLGDGPKTATLYAQYVSADLYAYAAGAAPGSPSSCPQTTTPAEQCTLTQALSLALPGSTVYLASPGTSGDYTGNWTVSTAGTSASAQVTLAPAAGLSAGPVLSGSGTTGSILTIGGDAYVTVTGLTFTGADATASSSNDGSGGAISSSTGSLTVSDSTFYGNSAVGGGAIASAGGSLTVSDSSFSGNSAADDGGAIDTGSGSSLVVTDSTFSGNQAGYNGDAIADGGSVWVAADVFGGSCSTADSGSWNDGGYNVGRGGTCESDGTGDSAALTTTELGSLAANGGPTETLLPLTGNPAIGLVPSDTSVTLDGASVQLCSRTDQRGVASVAGGACSAGAVEAIPAVSAPASTVATDGVTYSGTVGASGGTGPYSFALLSGSLPAGLRLTETGTGAGTISGTPSEVGSFPLTVAATDGDGDVGAASFTLTVAAPTIALSSATLPDATYDSHYSQTLSASGGTGPYSFALQAGSSLPTDLSLSGSGTISGTPAVGGSFSFTVDATDDSTGPGAPFSGSRTYTLVIAAISPGTPSISNLPSGATVYGSFTAMITGVASGDTGTTSVSSSTPSVCTTSGLKVDFVGPGTCDLSAAVTASAHGGYSAVQGAIQTVDVAPIAQAITFRPLSSAATAGTTAALSASGGSSGQPVTFSVAAGTSPADACSVSGSTVAYEHVGTCVVEASQAASANGDYGAAATVTQTVAVQAVASTVAMPAPPTTVFGQQHTVTATVSEADGKAPAGTVQFEVDGQDLGSPVSVGASGTATSPGLASLAPGAHTVTATFTPADASVYAATSASAPVTVDQAATSTSVTVTTHSVTATVTAVAPGAGTPTGTVDFSVGGASIGTATLQGGVATLAYAVPTAKTEQVAASYAGDTDFTGSSASTARANPSLKARITSAHRKSRYGWYRSAVTVRFTCTTHGAALTTACPAPVRLTASRAGQSVTRTVTATNGGAATLAVSGIDIDTTRPKLAVTGIGRGAVYDGAAPAARCKASERISGIASCTVRLHRDASRQGLDTTTVRYRATATSRAGITRTVSGSYRVLGIYLEGVRYQHGVFRIPAARTYTLVVQRSGARPRYVDGGPEQVGPSGDDNFLWPAGHGRWAIGVNLDGLFAPFRTWNLGVLIGRVVHTLRVRVA